MWLVLLLVGPTQLAQQNTNANAGAGGTAIGSGEATANMAGPTGPCYAGLPSYPGCLYGGSNTAQQTTNANAGAGGTAIAGGSATANYQGCKLANISTIITGIRLLYFRQSNNSDATSPVFFAEKVLTPWSKYGYDTGLLFGTVWNGWCSFRIKFSILPLDLDFSSPFSSDFILTSAYADQVYCLKLLPIASLGQL